MLMADGDYARLVELAQADADPQHRQLAMSQVSTIAPYVGFRGNSPADAMAEPIIQRLYPQPKPGPADDVAVTIAAIEAEARARIAEIVDRARTGVSAGQGVIQGDPENMTDRDYPIILGDSHPRDPQSP
jgi:hypothetical protein